MPSVGISVIQRRRFDMADACRVVQVLRNTVGREFLEATTYCRQMVISRM